MDRFPGCQGSFIRRVDLGGRRMAGCENALRNSGDQDFSLWRILFANIDRDTVLFFQGGWGKVAAAGSTQYVIDHFHPARLINIGTCGGVEGRIKCFDVVVIEKAVIYDIEETIGDSKQAIAAYSTSLSLPARFPVPVVKVTMYSADRDLTAAGFRELDTQHQLVVAD